MLGEILFIFIVVILLFEIFMFNERFLFDLLVVLFFFLNWVCLRIKEIKLSGKIDNEKEYVLL